jgi:toluene monooxygenase system ferredoxin subunit
MKLSDLVTDLHLEIQAGERWVVLGPEENDFGPRLHPAAVVTGLETIPDGLLLVGALSAHSEPLTWLEQVSKSLQKGANLIVIDWQYDGPPEVGPDLEQRLRRGGLCRWLRQTGFGLVETLETQPAYYMIRAVKGPPPATVDTGEFFPVAKLNELPKNRMILVELFGRQLIVANTGREIVAFARACPHASEPLDGGLLRGRNIVCRAHNYIWNVCTGEPVEPADEDILPRYRVRVERDRGEILVALVPLTNKHE